MYRTEISPRMAANFKYLYLDVLGFGVLAGSAMAFLAIFAARAGATNWQVGLLTAGPALVNLVLSIPAARWLHGRSFFKVSFWFAIWHRTGYLLLIPLTLIQNGDHLVWILVLVTALMAIPGVILAIAFNAMYAEAVPPAHRTLVVNRRNAILSVSTSLVSLLCGQILALAPYPLNYQIVFILGVAGAAYSSWALGKIESPENAPARAGRLLGDFARPGIMRFLDTLRTPVGMRFLTRRPPQILAILRTQVRSSFGRFMEVYLLFYLVQYLTIPLFPLYFVRVLALSDAQISLGNALFYSSMLIVSMLLSRFGSRFSHRQALVAGAFLYGLYPFFNALAQDWRWYLVASSVGGIAWAVANSGLVNRLMERVPEEQRSELMAVHNLVLNSGILFGALAGPLLAGAIGLRSAIWAGAILRFGVGILMWRWG